MPRTARVKSPPAVSPRPEGRVTVVLAEGPAEFEEAGESDDDAPADPVRAATAIGIAATADPTPSATASAPTRPT